MKKFFLALIVIVMASAFSLFAQEANKEKKVNWHFKVGYPILIGSNQIRSNWDLGYLTIQDALTKEIIDGPLFGTESWYENLEEVNLQKKAYPDEYTNFLFNKRVPPDEFSSYLDGRKTYNGFSKTTNKILFPEFTIGIDYKLWKNLFFSLDIFAMGNAVEKKEEGYILYIKEIIAGLCYYKNFNQPNEYLVTDWQMDAVFEHPSVVMDMNIITAGIKPMVKYKIPVSKGFSISPKAGVNVNVSKYNFTSNWKMNYIYPYHFVLNYRDKEKYFFDESNYIVKNSQTKYLIHPFVGIEMGAKIFLDAQIEFGALGNNMNIASKGDEPYKGLLLYESNNKINFPSISDEYQKYRVNNFGEPQNNDFINLKKINKIITVGIGIRF